MDARRIKRTHKNLMIFEAGFIYCKRHELDYETFENIFMSEEFDSSENGEFDNLCKDLRCYRHHPNYELIEMTEEEYSLCVIKFGEE